MSKLTGKKKASRDGKYHLMNFPRNWLHQALSYMDRGELAFRLFVEFGMAVILYYGFGHLRPGAPPSADLAAALFSAHTLNWLFNGNFWALYLFAVPHSRNRGRVATGDYLARMAIRLRAAKCIGGLALYGSVARDAWHSKSDLDIRVIREKGVGNLLCANILVMRERIIALMQRQPADMFLADGVEFLRKMRADETPVFLIKRMEVLDAEYPANGEIDGSELLVGKCQS